MVPPLPEEIGQRDGRRQGAAQPEPAMAQAGTKRRQADANDHSGEPEEDGIFVQDRDPRERANSQPKMFVAALGDAHDEVGDSRPKQRVEGVHGEQVRQGKQDGRHERRQRGQKHGPSGGLQLACQQARKNDGRSAGKGGQQPQCPERGADRVLQGATRSTRSAAADRHSPRQDVLRTPGSKAHRESIRSGARQRSRERCAPGRRTPRWLSPMRRGRASGVH